MKFFLDQIETLFLNSPKNVQPLKEKNNVKAICPCRFERSVFLLLPFLIVQCDIICILTLKMRFGQVCFQKSHNINCDGPHRVNINLNNLG